MWKLKNWLFFGGKNTCTTQTAITAIKKNFIFFYSPQPVRSVEKRMVRDGVDGWSFYRQALVQSIRFDSGRRERNRKREDGIRTNQVNADVFTFRFLERKNGILITFRSKFYLFRWCLFYEFTRWVRSWAKVPHLAGTKLKNQMFVSNQLHVKMYFFSTCSKTLSPPIRDQFAHINEKTAAIRSNSSKFASERSHIRDTFLHPCWWLLHWIMTPLQYSQYIYIHKIE